MELCDVCVLSTFQSADAKNNKKNIKRQENLEIFNIQWFNGLVFF